MGRRRNSAAAPGGPQADATPAGATGRPGDGVPPSAPQAAVHGGAPGTPGAKLGDRAVRRRLLRLSPRTRPAALLVLGAVLLGATGVVGQALALARLLGEAFSGSGTTTTAALWVAGAVAARGIAGWLQATAAQRAASEIKIRLRTGLLEAAAQRSPYDVQDRRTGEISTLLTRGLDALDPYLVGYVPQMLVAALVPPAVLAAMLLHDPLSGAVLLVTLPLIPVFGALVGLHTRDATARQWAALARLGGHFLDTLRGLPTLRTFGRAEAQEAIVGEVADAHRRATMRALRITFLSTLVLDTVGTLSIALIAVPVGLRLLDGSLDLTTALTVLLLAPEAYLPLRALGSRFHAGTEGMTTAREAMTLLGAEREPPVRRPQTAVPAAAEPRPTRPGAGAQATRDRGSRFRSAPGAPKGDAPRGAVDAGLCGPASPATPGPAAGAASGVPGPTGPPAPGLGGEAARGGGTGPHPLCIRFEDVTLRLPNRPRPVLSGVSFTVEPGERVALTGPSGAGKSTLLALLLGLVRPVEGRILVGGRDLGSLDPDDWRRHIGWVPQRPYLFDRTVADNIRLGDPGAGDQDVVRAARAAAADGFVRALPDGYATRLGARGTGLSAGQRQRIALARAFVRDAPLVLLDEPTAGLDADSETAVLAASERLMAGRTVLVVAHRSRLLDGADRRLDVRDGTVREVEVAP
jgi:ABC-type transport system involved in cytochrome bd biosynthesis fused ATPase/permease subunit